MFIVMLLKDSSCGARQGLSLLHYVDLEFRLTQLNLRFSNAVWWKIVASTCISERSNMKIDVLARVNCILCFTFTLHSKLSVFVLEVAALLVGID